jgi:hypothetical protein
MALSDVFSFDYNADAEAKQRRAAVSNNVISNMMSSDPSDNLSDKLKADIDERRKGLFAGSRLGTIMGYAPDLSRTY